MGLSYAQILTFVIDDLEGGARVIADAGGATKYGISAKAHPGLDVASLSREDAEEIYRKEYWDALNCDALFWPLNLYIFDAAVNQGPRFAHQVVAAASSPEEALLLRVSRYGATASDPARTKNLLGWINRIVKVWLLGQQP